MSIFLDSSILIIMIFKSDHYVDIFDDYLENRHKKYNNYHYDNKFSHRKCLPLI